MPAAQGSLLVDRYRVLRRLGAGGAAVVFLAEDQRLGRKVAVKRLHSHHATGMAERFAREARLGASLNHPNLVSIFDTETDEEGVLIVMEYVEGRTLADALSANPLVPSEAARVVAAVAAALDHAHSHGVTHRDVKPANILLRSDGMVKLADLGIATAAEHTRITSSGMVLGTASYMAPEQLEGGEAGPAADVYALACVAFEALSGKKARPGRNPMEVAHRLAAEPVPDLAEAWPGAPPAAPEILRRGMATDPYDRPPAAGRLAADLERAISRPRPPPPASAEPHPATERRPVAPVPTPAPTRERPPVERAAAPAPPRPARDAPTRRRLPWAALAVLAVAAATVAAAALLGGGGGGGDRPAPDRPSSSAPKAKAPAGSKSADSGTQATDQGGGSAAGGSATGATTENSGSAGSAVPDELNRQGFALASQGRYDEAIPLLQRAARSFPESSTDLTYAYALFNLGHALRLAGRSEEAVPILERRMKIPNQTETVRRELAAARRAAGP